ncbi:DUF3576 domain-containing protein [Pseudoroseicyclus aestuarii]|uniref:Uncharacterized protein DUF3576 n=1 Tax=Pseudoroseicyclus aestuarii TaxID=1795041 RepID=A0A318SP66_9RHOB|nr:DUF3576 domain-containing protein [Pseudoroseicyclus aestuarii]PYE83670.1 uncharacterized protein DUF3576 [Pseudoroseicyclus aestuarii]
MPSMPRSLRLTAILALCLGLAACGGRNPAGGPSAEAVAVNRYLWTASLDVLDFLPVQNVDPFTGVITTGYGTPPGGSQPYRAVIHVSDPALDARALSVALATPAGPVARDTQIAVENAILSRARQLRIADGY